MDLIKMFYKKTNHIIIITTDLKKKHFLKIKENVIC